MLEMKIQGYLIFQKDINVYDQILTYITNTGNVKSFYAQGVKKINSKNARSIKYGDYVEIEYFASTNTKKISKLKKVVSIKEFNFKNYGNFALLIMNGLIYIQKYIDKIVFEIYQEILVLINREYNYYFISIYLIIKFCSYFYNKLNKFKTKNYIYYDKLINKNSLKLNHVELDFLNKIVNGNLSISNLYKFWNSSINFEDFFYKIYQYWKYLILRSNKYE